MTASGPLAGQDESPVPRAVGLLSDEEPALPSGRVRVHHGTDSEEAVRGGDVGTWGRRSKKKEKNVIVDTHLLLN